MRLDEIINTHRQSLNDTDMVIWKYILQHREVARHISIHELAKACCVSSTHTCASRRSSASTASASSRPSSRWKRRRRRATARTCSRTSVISTSRRGRRSSSATSTARAASCTRQPRLHLCFRLRAGQRPAGAQAPVLLRQRLPLRHPGPRGVLLRTRDPDEG